MQSEYKLNDQIIKDLEEMRRQQKELEECEREMKVALRKHEMLLETAPDAMVFVDKKGRIVFVNVQLEKLFGFREEELVGRNVEILIPERFRAGHSRNVSIYFSTPGVRHMGADREIFGLKKDGTEFQADVRLSQVEANGTSLAIATIRDITEKRRAESKIKRNYYIQKVISSVLKISLEPSPLEDQLEHILVPILVIPGFALKSAGSIYLVEDEPEVLVLKTPHRFPHVELSLCEKIPFGKCLCGQAAATRRMVFADCLDARHDIVHRDEVPHGHYCVPIVSGEKTLGLINVFVREGHRRTFEEEEFLAEVAMTLAGVIERHHAEEEKNRLKAQLAEGEKMSALGRITANVAHEIRNPLTAIGGFTRRLHKKFANGTKEKEYTGLIFSEVIRLEGILRNVLSFSKTAGPHFEECNLREIIERSLKVYEEICSEQAIVVNRSFADIAPVNGDREQILQAIENLISNAIDAMLGGGILTITTMQEMVRGIPYAVVSIRDTGRGIEAADLSKIFEPFFTTKLALKGAGLGLSITKKIVEDHGGFVRVESKIGSGSTFSIFLPFKSYNSEGS